MENSAQRWAINKFCWSAASYDLSEDDNEDPINPAVNNKQKHNHPRESGVNTGAEMVRRNYIKY